MSTWCVPQNSEQRPAGWAARAVGRLHRAVPGAPDPQPHPTAGPAGAGGSAGTMSARSERTRPIHLLLGGWVAANGVLTGILFIYHPQPISVALYAAALVIVSGFGLAVLAAARQGRVGGQRRIAVRGTSAVLAAVG